MIHLVHLAQLSTVLSWQRVNQSIIFHRQLGVHVMWSHGATLNGCLIHLLGLGQEVLVMTSIVLSLDAGNDTRI